MPISGAKNETRKLFFWYVLLSIPRKSYSVYFVIGFGLLTMHPMRMSYSSGPTVWLFTKQKGIIDDRSLR